MDNQNRIEVSLLLMRVGIFIVMFAWTIDKFLNPGHAVNIFEGFYFIEGVGQELVLALGVAELILIFAFLGGLWKRHTYGIVMVLHGFSTISSWEKYTINISLLFFAAIPMLAACIALYLMRDMDVKYTIKR